MRMIKMYQPYLFFCFWALATVTGTALGIEIVFRLYHIVESYVFGQSSNLAVVGYPVLTATAVGISIGFSSGLPQAFLLRRFFSIPVWKWVLATVLPTLQGSIIIVASFLQAIRTGLYLARYVENDVQLADLA